MAPDITRLFKGTNNDFEVEVVYANLGDQSPKESHAFEELILVLTGIINLERGDMPEIKTHQPYDLIQLPPGTTHQITPQATPTRLLVIHPHMPWSNISGLNGYSVSLQDLPPRNQPNFLEVIVAGTDIDEAHIYGIRHPGEVDFYDSLGYHAVGIGAIHAVSSLIANGCIPTTSINMAVYFEYEAKKNAENAPMVGKDTDMGIIKESGYDDISSEQVGLLEQIYDTRRLHQTDDFKKAIESLPFGK